MKRLSFLADRLPNGYPYRTQLLLVSVGIAILIGVIQQYLGEPSMHDLATAYARTGTDVSRLINGWQQTDNRLFWAWLEVLVDLVLFIPAYTATVMIWCWFCAHETLYVRNPAHPRLGRLMNVTGRVLAVSIWITGLADLLENTVMLQWLLGHEGFLSPAAMRLVWWLKMGPIAAALWYIALHPIAIAFSVWDTIRRWLFGRRGFYATTLNRLVRHMIRRRQQRKRVVDTVNERCERVPPRKATLRDRLNGLWKGFLNVQLIVYLLAASALVFQLGQFDEIFYLLLTQKQGIAMVLFSTGLSLGWWSQTVYICSKVMLYIQPSYYGALNPARPEAAARQIVRFRNELQVLRLMPLLLAGLPFAIAIVTVLVNYYRLHFPWTFEPISPDGFRPAVRFYSVLFTLILIAGSLLWLLRRFDRRLQYTDIVLFGSESPVRDYAMLVDLAPRSILFGQGTVVGLLLVFLPGTGLMLAQGIGLYAVVLLWLCGFAFLITILYQLNQLPRYPVLVITGLLLLIFSRCNDNSGIQESSLPAPLPRQSLESYYRRWLDDRPGNDNTPLPVVVVATAGGGIRATNWTTECLATLRDNIRGFDRYVFGISGVSGGGVGAATYVASLKGFVAPDSAFRLRLRSIVTQDLISPAVASALFRGGVNNFSPVPIAALDRNRWIEDAWQNALFSQPLDTAVQQTLRQSFLRLWTPGSTNLPCLFLNTTIAETGQKGILTNVSLGNTSDSLNAFFDVADLFSSFQHDIPYKTATFLCARFPFVTSGGKATGPLPNIESGSAITYHMLDGGYVENTGIVTAVQVIRALQRVTPGGRWRSRPVQYYLLFLRNGSVSEQAANVSLFKFANEPLKGFLQSWERAGVGLDQLVRSTLNGEAAQLDFQYTSLGLESGNHNYPLGWYISPTAADTMGIQARSAVGNALKANTSVLTRLRRQIGQ
ncbi:hypothetical protein DYU11_01280 [Fibrisoma montanum]|uniref:PNPLA domain-containing protein n=1 Tax=Fibrisoma montanum TaxID=2305895 RepID=A0A418MI21_9BACT|nr:hypothetical protein [Fibrisoma montanum]RIV26981.1 hypothetical protein DYU11_01280 [Fibrisoma montanum]